MLALVESESSFGAYVCDRRPGGSTATSDLVTLDQAIYCKAQEIKWKHPGQFKSVVLCMGGFHIAGIFMAVLGKRFGDGGLHDLLVESGVLAAGSAASVLDGKHCNRGIRVQQVIWEALSRLRWRQFENFLEGEGRGCPIDFDHLAKVLSNVRSDPSAQKFAALTASGDITALLTAYRGFCNEDHGPLFAFWSSYISMVELLLAFIRSIRTGDWTLHCSCLRSMLPWIYAYDRVNYARYMTIYVSEMEQLEKTHPTAHRELQQGQFAVQRAPGHAFAQVPVDQAIEQSLNRDSTTRGGIIGFSLKPGAVHRWIITTHERSAVS